MALPSKFSIGHSQQYQFNGLPNAIDPSTFSPPRNPSSIYSVAEHPVDLHRPELSFRYSDASNSDSIILPAGPQFRFQHRPDGSWARRRRAQRPPPKQYQFRLQLVAQLHEHRESIPIARRGTSTQGLNATPVGFTARIAPRIIFV